MKYILRKKHILSLALVVAALLVINFLPGKELTGKVVSVQDGDTVTLLQGTTQYKIRLDGVDCPEKNQPFGNVAKQFTSDMVFGKTIKVSYEGKDRYQRYLGVVICGKQNLNKELLKAGLAWHYKQYNSDSVLAALEIKARKDKKGLWADKNPIPPWDWRKSRRKNT